MTIFFDESSEDLREHVLALEGVADRLVAVDGAWEGFDDRPHSPAEQVQAIADACVEAGLDLTLHRPASHWPSEVAHRNYALGLVVADADWILHLDADERLGEASGLRAELETMTEHVGEVRFLTVMGPQIAGNLFEIPGLWKPQRRVFRVLPNMRYEQMHWYLYADGADGGRIALWGGMTVVPSKLLDVTVEHRTCLRSGDRAARKSAYYEAREAGRYAQ